MFESLFESTIKESILFFIFINKESYASELARNFDFNLYAVQNQLKKLEAGAVLYSQLKGKVRIFGMNPRYAFKKELEALLLKGYNLLSYEVRSKYYMKRNRPRRTGKEL